MEANGSEPLDAIQRRFGDNFASILRRSFLWRPHARFVAPQFLQEHYQDAEQDGYFPKDPTLKDFLVSGPAIASSMQLQHAFEEKHSRQECFDLVEAYCNLGGDNGLAEDLMRVACGLPPRRRDKAVAPGFVQEPGLSQEREDGLRQQFLNVMCRIVEELLAKGIPILTFGKFKSMSLPQCSDIPNLDRDSMLKQFRGTQICA